MAKAKIYLYKEGNECTSLTGGWSKTLNATKTIQGGILNIQTTSTTSRASVSCVELIDFTNFDKAVFIAEGTGTLSINSSSFVIKSDNNFSTGNFIVSNIPAESATNFKKQSIEINLSSINNGYIGYLKGGHTSAFSTNVKIYEVYLTTKENILTINSQTNDNITFSANDLGLVTISKIDVLVNNVVSKTYTDDYSNLSYTVDKSLCAIGNNNIEIRVTYSQGDDITEAVSEYLTYKYTVPPLPLETPLLDIVERVKLLTKSKQSEKTMLSSILTSKNVEVSEEDKMSDLIGKVDLLGDAPLPPLYLYKDGDECIELTGGWLKGGYTRGTGTLTKEDDCMKLYTNTSANQTVTVLTKNKVDLTGYSKIVYDLTLTASPDAEWSNVGVTDSVSSASNNPVSSTSFEDGKKYTNEDITIFCDISNINSNKYVFVCNNTGSGTTATFKIKNIWLESR